MAYVYALDDCVTFIDKQRVSLSRDQVWDAGDPIVKKRPDLFSDKPRHAHNTVGDVEQATAAPGEKRAAKKRAVKK